MKKGNKFKKYFQISGEKANILILAFTFLTLAFVQIIIAVYGNTILSIPKWLNPLNFAVFAAIILLIAYLIFFLKIGVFWKVFGGIILFIIYLAAIANFTFLYPNFYTKYNFSCGLSSDGEPIINFDLTNVGDRMSVNHILINISNSNYSILYKSDTIDGNMRFRLYPNENIKTSFKLKFKESQNRTNHTIKINNYIDCDAFSCRNLAKFDSDRTCRYKCFINVCRLLE